LGASTIFTKSCHLHFFPNKDGEFYYYKSIVTAKNETLISYKIKQNGGDEFNYVLCDPWIESLLRHKLGNVKNIGSKCGFFL
jgi:hypothetical protein